MHKRGRARSAGSGVARATGATPLAGSCGARSRRVQPVGTRERGAKSTEAASPAGM
jgi:hypothetical protein